MGSQSFTSPDDVAAVKGENTGGALEFQVLVILTTLFTARAQQAEVSLG